MPRVSVEQLQLHELELRGWIESTINAQDMDAGEEGQLRLRLGLDRPIGGPEMDADFARAPQYPSSNHSPRTSHDLSDQSPRRHSELTPPAASTAARDALKRSNTVHTSPLKPAKPILALLHEVGSTASLKSWKSDEHAEHHASQSLSRDNEPVTSPQAKQILPLPTASGSNPDLREVGSTASLRSFALAEAPEPAAGAPVVPPIAASDAHEIGSTASLKSFNPDEAASTAPSVQGASEASDEPRKHRSSRHRDGTKRHHSSKRRSKENVVSDFL